MNSRKSYRDVKEIISLGFSGLPGVPPGSRHWRKSQGNCKIPKEILRKSFPYVFRCSLGHPPVPSFFGASGFWSSEQFNGESYKLCITTAWLRGMEASRREPQQIPTRPNCNQSNRVKPNRVRLQSIQFHSPTQLHQGNQTQFKYITICLIRAKICDSLNLMHKSNGHNKFRSLCIRTFRIIWNSTLETIENK